MAEDARARIVDATMRLAALRRFEDITIRDIATEAGVSLADFRDAFPSKGAVLGGLSRRVDRAVLEAPLGELAQSPPRDRLFDVLMRRLDALAPYREGLREVLAWARREPIALMELNRMTINSMRFMLEAADIESDGPGAALKLQGLALAWARVLDTWLDDMPPDYAKTMAALDRELTRGEKMVSGLQKFERFTEPFRRAMNTAAARRTRNDGMSDPETAIDPSI